MQNILRLLHDTDCKECKEPRFFPPAIAHDRKSALENPDEFRKRIGGFVDKEIFTLSVDEEFKCVICLDVLLEAQSCQVSVHVYLSNLNTNHTCTFDRILIDPLDPY